MARPLFTALLGAVVLFIISACGREDQKAEIPAYLSIDGLNLSTEYSDEGTASSSITTVWVFVNDEAVGAFEVPCKIPVLAEGNVTLEIIPGITMNGIDATRAIYAPFDPIIQSVNFNPLDTLSLGVLDVNYALDATITIVEDFDQTGQNLIADDGSDTNVISSSDPNDIFINPDNTEDNGKAGVVTLTPDQIFFELRTIDRYVLPGGSRSVYLEMNYKNNIPIVVGVIANSPEGSIQAQTITLNTKEDWNKIYINLVTEISAYPSADSFQIFIGGFNTTSSDTAKVYLDNLKIVY